MKCYYHENRDAVAQCNSCGKGICRECAGEMDIPLCPSCASRIENTEKELESLERDGVICEGRSAKKYLIACAIAAAAQLLWCIISRVSNGTPLNIFDLIAFIVAGCIPLGMRATRDTGLAEIPLIGFIIRLSLSVWIGVFCAPVQLFKIIRAIREAKRAEGT